MIKGNKFACLTYHALAERTDQYGLSEGQLRDQLALLQRETYVVDGFEGLELRLRSGQSLPSRYVVLTVDDGYASAMQVADFLGKDGCQASFFFTREASVSKLGFAREKDIRELRKRGFSVGTHGATHRGLPFLPKEHCLAELAESKRWLEDVISEEVRYTAAPGGFINPRVMKSAFRCGYALVGTCNEWMNSPDTMTLPSSVDRVSVRRHFSIRAFRHIVEGHSSFYVWRRVRAGGLAIPKRLLYRWNHPGGRED